MSTHKTPKTQAMFERAKKVMPWGVSSNFRYWGEETTPVVSRASGAYLWETLAGIAAALGGGPVGFKSFHPEHKP